MDTSKGRQIGNISSRSPSPLFKNMFRFCPFLSPKFPRKHQSTPKIYSLLPLFALFRCLFVLVECRRTPRDAGVNICRLLYSEDATNDTHPPPIWGRKTPFTPIIFRTKKVEKSSPQENIIFRTKNTEKSRLGLIGKNFGKNLRENVSG